MENKKKIFIVSLILLIGLAIFAFANPVKEDKDIVSPKGTVTYKELGDCKVRVTIKANEDIKNISGWKKVNGRTFEKDYFDNIKEYIEIKDLANNKSKVKVEIKNLDCTGETDKEIEKPVVTPPVKEEITTDLTTPGTTTPVAKDKIAPIITLNGSNLTIEREIGFVEPGFSATDNLDGNITSKTAVTYYEVNGTVEVQIPNLNNADNGVYIVEYTVVDSSGNKTTVRRTVTIEDTIAPVITVDYITENINETVIKVTADELITITEAGWTCNNNVCEKTFTSNNPSLTITAVDASGNNTVNNEAVTSILSIVNKNTDILGNGKFRPSFNIDFDIDFGLVNNNSMNIGYEYSVNGGPRQTAIFRGSNTTTKNIGSALWNNDGTVKRLVPSIVIKNDGVVYSDNLNPGGWFPNDWKNLRDAINALDGTGGTLELFPTVTVVQDGVSKSFDLNQIDYVGTPDVTAPTGTITETKISINETKLTLITDEEIKTPANWTKIDATTYELIVIDNNETITVTLEDLAGNINLVDLVFTTTQILEATLNTKEVHGNIENGLTYFHQFNMSLNNEFKIGDNGDFKVNYYYKKNNDTYTQDGFRDWNNGMNYVHINGVRQMCFTSGNCVGREFAANSTYAYVEKKVTTLLPNLLQAVRDTNGTNDIVTVKTTVTITQEGVSKEFDLFETKYQNGGIVNNTQGDIISPTITVTKENININDVTLKLVADEAVVMDSTWTKVSDTEYIKVVDKNNTYTISTTDIAGNTSNTETIIVNEVLEATLSVAGGNGTPTTGKWSNFYSYYLMFNNDLTVTGRDGYKQQYEYRIEDTDTWTTVSYEKQIGAAFNNNWIDYRLPNGTGGFGSLTKLTYNQATGHTFLAGTRISTNEQKPYSVIRDIYNLVTATTGTDSVSVRLVAVVNVDGVEKKFPLPEVKYFNGGNIISNELSGMVGNDLKAPIVLDTNIENTLSGSNVTITANEDITISGWTCNKNTCETTLAVANPSESVTISDLEGNTTVHNFAVEGQLALSREDVWSNKLVEANNTINNFQGFVIAFNKDIKLIQDDSDNELTISTEYSTDNGANFIKHPYERKGWAGMLKVGATPGVDGTQFYPGTGATITAGTNIESNETQVKTRYTDIYDAILATQGNTNTVIVKTTITLTQNGVAYTYVLDPITYSEGGQVNTHLGAPAI